MTANGTPGNRLATATSDYLRLHADNPVDWREWGSAAFAEARERDVPVFVSVGYATCHWCHVMARESFSSEAIAAQLRAGFVAVKVDREEQPDVDSALMAAASAFTRHLGWPLSVFLTPEGLPFFAGTYFPLEARQGVPGFGDVLTAVSSAWREQPDAARSTAARVQEAVAAATFDAPPEPLDRERIVAALRAVAEEEDHEFGGIGTSQKFPHAPLVLALADVEPALATRLLDAAVGDDEAHDRVVATGAGWTRLRARDGGCFRYATRRDWASPHFERMLVDNAQMLHAATVLGRGRFAEGLVDFLGGVLRLPGGAFAVAEDAESVVESDGDEQRVEGGWHLAPGRVRPALDRLVVTAANGLAIEALAVRALRDEDDRALELAEAAAEWLLAEHTRTEPEGERRALLHASLDGVPSSAAATAADAGSFAAGLLALAAATGEVRWASAARDLIEHASDPVDRLDAHDRTPSLALGPASDGDAPSGRAALAGALATLYALTGDDAYRERAERILRPALAIAQPIMGAATLEVAMRLSVPPRTLVLIGEPGQRWRRRPGAFVATAEQAAALAAAGFTLFEGKTGGAYACENFTCALPEPL